MNPIPFFTDDISIIPHSASNQDFLGREVSIAEFSGGRPCLVCDLDDGELCVSLLDSGRFMQGPEAVRDHS